MLKFKSITLSIFCTSLMLGCSSSKNGDSLSSVVSQFDSAMQSAGGQLQSTALVSGLSSGSLKNTLTDVDEACDENARPMSGGSEMNQNDPEYPARLIYCKVVKNTGSPDSIVGSYTQTKSIACALEHAGIEYDGVEHEATVQINSDCFTAEELADGEMPASIQVTYKASKPAFFNENFQSGVEMTITGFGTFALATSVDDSVIQFMGYENQGSTKTGVYMGQFDSASGEIRFEGRHERINCDEDHSCGWNRHDRIYLKCGSISDEGECESVQKVQAAASDIFADPVGGQLATLSGDFSVGVKTRFYYNTGGDFTNEATWTEELSGASRCYTHESPTAGDCSSNNGIQIQSDTILFPLFDSYTPATQWYKEVDGLDFTSIDLQNE